MKKIYNNPVFRYVLIACLSVALLLGQAVKLHMHVQHDEVSSVGSVIKNSSLDHIVDVHVSSSLHNTTHGDHHLDDFQDHHNNADIDISPDGFLKVSKVLNLFVFLLLVASLALSVPLLQRTRKKNVFQILSPTKYYLLHAPLRAPPI
jgi:hypothetical protein